MLDTAAVTKWVLNRAEQAMNTKALYTMCDINAPSEMYKPSRPSQILQSENRVASIVNVLRDEYLNPFEVCLDKSVLFNLSSGIPIPKNIADEILSLPVKGKGLADKFLKTRVLTNKVSFNDPIKRNINKTRLSTKKDIKIVRGNRNILGKLVAYSAKSGKVVDYAEVLKYPLSHTPLSICHPDGVKRKCNKDEIMPLIIPDKLDSSQSPADNDVSGYIYDIMAGIRLIQKTPDTFEALTWSIIKMLPIGYARVDLVADSYRSISIKDGTQSERGV